MSGGTKRVTKEQRRRRLERRARARRRRARPGTQLGLEIPEKFGWGGRRERAGRRPGPRPLARHRRRERFPRRFPLHVTLRVGDRIPSLRSMPLFDVICLALAKARTRLGVRIVGYTVQGDHVHLVVEAVDFTALARAMTGLQVRIARAANAILERKGAVFAGRFHSSVLRSPSQVRNALGYLVDNAARHARSAGRALADAVAARFTSLGFLDLRAHRPWAERATGPPVLAAPETWLLRAGWQLG